MANRLGAGDAGHEPNREGVKEEGEDADRRRG